MHQDFLAQTVALLAGGEGARRTPWKQDLGNHFELLQEKGSKKVLVCASEALGYVETHP